MFETGMSALVLKICSEYAKALGLNFPPCVQQEINAIAQYVDLHTVKDLKVEQDGSVVTITCFTEGGQVKVFTVTLPEVNVDVLYNLIKGSQSVVVDKSEDGTHLVVRLDKSQEFEVVDIGSIPEISNEQYELLIANPNSVLVFQGQTYYNGGLYQGKTNLLWYVCFSHYQYINMMELFINKTTRAITTKSTPLVDEYHVVITPDSATQGTLSQSELEKLMGNEYSYIVLNNELYRLADKGHTEGVWSYVHTGWDGSAIQNKSINITISTRAWKQVVGTSGGLKLYRHKITLYYSDYDIAANVICYASTQREFNFYDLYAHISGYCAVRYVNVNVGEGAVSMTMTADEIDDQKFAIRLRGAIDETNGSAVIVDSTYTTKGSGDILQLNDIVTEV